MASVRVVRPDVFAAGTVVSAYVWPATTATPSGVPGGTVIETATVQADGSVTFIALAERLSYVLYAAAPDRYVRVNTSRVNSKVFTDGATLYDDLGTELPIAGDVSALAARVSVVEEAPLHAPAYGFASDKTAAENRAVLDELVGLLPANGGTVELGRGLFNVNGFPSLQNLRSVVFRGEGGRSAGAGEGTRLVTSQTGAGRFVDARNTFGVCLEHVALRHGAGFTGTLLDASNPAGADTAYLMLRDVVLGKAAGSAAATGLNLVKAIDGCFDGVTFDGLDVGVLGRAVTSDYSNVHNFRACTWLNIGTAPVKNIGSAWLFESPTVEPLVSGDAAFIARAAGMASHGGGILGGWMGDTGSGAAGDWVQWAGSGFQIAGTVFGYCARGVVADEAAGTPIGCRGLSIMGCQLPPTNIAVRLNNATFIGVHRNHQVMANDWQASTFDFDTYLPLASLIMGPEGLVSPLDFTELAALQPNGFANGSRLYTVDNGSGKTRLSWRTDSASNTVTTSA